MDLPWKALGFHPAGDVHRISPQVVHELLMSDYPADHRSRIDSDAELDRATVLWPVVDVLAHIQSQTSQGVGVIRALPGRS